MKGIVYLSALTILPAGAPPDVAFVPPLVRRRLSPLQKIYFSLAHAVAGDAVESSVFATRDGEDTYTRRIVDSFNEERCVSPHLFSSSVYNAAPGLWSVFTKNRAPYAAVAAGNDTLECGLLETLNGKPTSLFVYAEETDGGYGAAVLFSAEPGKRRLSVGKGDATRPSLSFADFAAFLSGDAHELRGRWLTIRDLP